MLKNMLLHQILTLTLLLTLSACAQVAPGETDQPSPALPDSKETPTQAPQTAEPRYAISPDYPAPGTPQVEGQLSEFIEGASLKLSKTTPARPILVVTGSLPTPCHQLAFKVAPPSHDNQVSVSLAIIPPPPGVNCTDVLALVEREIPLGKLVTGTYPVLINGIKVGTIAIP